MILMEIFIFLVSDSAMKERLVQTRCVFVALFLLPPVLLVTSLEKGKNF